MIGVGATRLGNEASEALLAYRSRVPFLRFQSLREGAAGDVYTGGVSKALVKLDVAICCDELIKLHLLIALTRNDARHTIVPSAAASATGTEPAAAAAASDAADVRRARRL